MPALTPYTEAVRTTQAAHALSLMMQGKNQREACSEAGISPAQFRAWIGKEPEAIVALRDMTIELERENLSEIIATRALIMRRLLDTIAATPLPAKDLVVVDQHLAKVQEELETKYGTQSGDQAAEEYLKLAGPALSKHQSVFSAKVTQTTTTMEITPIQDEIHKEDIIEAQYEDESEEEGD